MLIAAIITGLISLVFGILWVFNAWPDNYGDRNFFFPIAFLVTGFIWLFCFFAALNLQFGSSQLTGYIYSASDTAGYTTGHIRFSENAGTDQQPSFCAKSDSKAGQQIRELAGSGKKVSVTIPPFFYFSNNLFACGTTETKIRVVL